MKTATWLQRTYCRDGMLCVGEASFGRPPQLRDACLNWAKPSGDFVDFKVPV